MMLSDEAVEAVFSGIGDVYRGRGFLRTMYPSSPLSMPYEVLL